MTPQEQKMLEDLMARVDNTRLEERDPEAAQHIEQWTARNHDAAYILAQTVLVQTYALDQAKAQIASLQQQLQQAQQHQPAKPGSFLGGLFGHKEEAPPPPPPPPAARAGYTPVPQYGQPQSAQPPQPAYGAPQGYAPAGGGSSFLRSAAQTAAGVAAGALAFEGIESLMHGFGHSAGFGGGGGFGLGEMGGRPEETVINNYYDTPSPDRDAASQADIQQFAHAGDSSLNPQDDTADDMQVADDGTLQADTDLPTLDDGGSYDDASLDDGGGFDDGGGSDDSLS